MLTKAKELFHYLKDHRSNSILIKNFAVLSVILMVPLSGLSYLFFNRLTHAVEGEIASISVASLGRFQDAVGGVMSDMDHMSLLFSLDEDAQLFFSSSDGEPLLFQQYEVIFNYLRMYDLAHDYIDAIYFYSEARRYVLGVDGGYLSDMRDRYWFEEYQQNRTRTEPWLMVRRKYDIYPYLLTLVRPVFSDDRNTRYGAILININVEELQRHGRSRYETDDDRLFVVGSDDTVIMSDSRRMLFTDINDIVPSFATYAGTDAEAYLEVVEEVPSVVSISGDPRLGLRYVSILPLVRYEMKQRQIFRYFLLLLGLCLITAFVLSLLISIRSYIPVFNIFNLLENPDFDAGATENLMRRRGGEYVRISENIVKLMYSNEELRSSLRKRVDDLHNAQFLALQTQIQPHFLYNTLETIRWLVVQQTGRENKPSHMIYSLSKLLRFSLESSEALVSIAQEIDHVRSYLDLMLCRYEDQVAVDWEVDQRLVSFKTIRLVIQPLVENAIYHGIKPLKSVGRVTIGVRRGDGGIILYVGDDGVGMDERERAILVEELSTGKDLDKPHIGLRNVNQRIKLQLGERYGVVVPPQPKGFTAELHLPAIT